jgi:hypothetical protein
VCRLKQKVFSWHVDQVESTCYPSKTNRSAWQYTGLKVAIKPGGTSVLNWAWNSLQHGATSYPLNGSSSRHKNKREPWRTTLSVRCSQSIHVSGGPCLLCIPATLPQKSPDTHIKVKTYRNTIQSHTNQTTAIHM